ncbi:MAG: carboxymuconolactone decarboxylase family protein [Actinomycetota bacterium]|jgi:4-carboxymuconolactone decarboxylase|nr:carboxymuconolactone decarboxylase family protein [Actinomycetota bacterium]
MRDLVDQIDGAPFALLAGATHLLTLKRADEVAGLVEQLAASSWREGGAMAEDYDPSDGYRSSVYAAGMRARREVLTDEHVDGARAATSDFSDEFQDFITLHAWAASWARPVLDRRMRSALTLALLAALHNDHEIPMHVKAAIRHGLTPEEIREVFFHTAVYAGVPVANHAMATADAALRELGLATGRQ